MNTRICSPVTSSIDIKEMKARHNGGAARGLSTELCVVERRAASGYGPTRERLARMYVSTLQGEVVRICRDESAFR